MLQLDAPWSDIFADLSPGLTALFGLALMVVGALLIALAARAIGRRILRRGRRSRLVPALAEEVLDGDLQKLYRHSRRLDAALAEGDGSNRSSETGSPFGRAVRRYLVTLQVERHAARRRRRDGKGADPPDERLEQVADLLDEALADAEDRGAAQRLPEGLEAHAARLEEAIASRGPACLKNKSGS